MPNLSVIVERRSPDSRSADIQCQLRIQNLGESDVRLLSVKVSNAQGTTVQQVLDSESARDRAQRDNVLRELEDLLNPIISGGFADYKNRVEPVRPPAEAANVRPATSEPEAIRAARSAWRLKIRDAAEAQEFFDLYVKPIEGMTELKTLFESKLSTARRLEARLGLDRSPKPDQLTTTEYLTDIEPQEQFVRDYIIRCPRRSLVSTPYTMHFDCRYIRRQNGEWSEPLMKNQSLTETIAAGPVMTSAFAAVCSAFGTVLRTTLDLAANEVPSWSEVWSLFFSGAMAVSLISAAVTAIIFFNVYDWTDIGKKVDPSSGWRSALVIGAMSGLLNERVVAALKDLFG
jgi:hypothetical protein